MDAEKFDELNYQLWNTQYRKSQGLISTPLFQKFISFIEITHERLNSINAIRDHSFTVHATLAAKTREKEYDTVPYPIVGYCGPYTVVHYKNGEYFSERYESNTEWYAADRKHEEGVNLEIRFTGSVFLSLESIIDAVQRKADLSSSYISSGKDNTLTLSLWVPSDRLA